MSQEKDADAMVRFGSTADRMKLGISRYVPAQGSGQPLSVALLRRALAEAGVTAALDEQRAAEAVRLLLSGQDASSLVIARGVPPVSPQHAWLEPLGALALPVFPGQAFARLHPAVEGKEGRDIAGNPVPPPVLSAPGTLSSSAEACAGAARHIAVGGGISQDREGLLTATIPGVARITEDRIELEPLVRIAPDRLQAMADLYPRDALGEELSPEFMVQTLAGQGVRFGIQLEGIVRGLAQARAGNAAVQNVLVAQGKPPVPGQDGRLELLVREAGGPAEADEGGRLDYRDRGPFPVAEQGQEIARLHPPTKGVPGQDVSGGVVPARDGVALRVQAGRNVEVLEGGALYRAKMAGVVLADKARLEISELLTLTGDVDYGTGNIQLDQGSVRVGGTVRTGFTVQASGNILVEGMVESARVIAGGDVIVRGGIFMSGDEAAFVQAGGSITASYSHNAQVHAGGDVTMALAIVGSKTNKGSRVTSGGMVRVTDAKGRIMGGTVVCGSGLEVFQAGSERGMATTLALSHESPEAEALVKEMRELKELRQRAVFVLGEGDGAAALARLPVERRAEAEELLARREDADSRLRQLQRSLAEIAQAHLERQKSARIVIRGTAFPGVAIKMGGRALYVERPMERCVFSWDAQNKQIVTGGL